MSNVPGVPRMLDPQLLVVQYTTKKTGHCMAIIHKRDYSNPTVLMQLYDVQKSIYIGPSAIDMPKILQFTASIKSSLKSRKTIVD